MRTLDSKSRLSTRRVPRRAMRSARAPPRAAAGRPRLPRPAQPNGIPKMQSPAKKAPGKKDHCVLATCGVCFETRNPPRGAAMRCGGALGMASQRSSLGETSKPGRARVTPWSCGAVRLLLGCAARPPATACGVGVHLGGHGLRERLRGQSEPLQQPADPPDDCLGAKGRRGQVGGWGCAAHLDRGDQRYQRKHPRIVRRALLVVVHEEAGVNTTTYSFCLPRSNR